MLRCPLRPCGCPAATDHSEHHHPTRDHVCAGGNYLPSLSPPERKWTEDPSFPGNVKYNLFYSVFKHVLNLSFALQVLPGH